MSKLKLDRDKPYGKIVSATPSTAKFAQNGLHYTWEGDLIFDDAAKAAGIKKTDIDNDTSKLVDDIKYTVYVDEEKVVIPKETSKTDKILTKSGKPYKTQKAAEINIVRKNLEIDLYEAKPYKDGWAIVRKNT